MSLSILSILLFWNYQVHRNFTHLENTHLSTPYWIRRYRGFCLPLFHSSSGPTHLLFHFNLQDFLFHWLFHVDGLLVSTFFSQFHSTFFWQFHFMLVWQSHFRFFLRFNFIFLLQFHFTFATVSPHVSFQLSCAIGCEVNIMLELNNRRLWENLNYCEF